MSTRRRQRRFRMLALGAGLLISGCDLVGTDEESFETVTSHQAAADIEALIGGAIAGWWRSSHGPEPGAALSTAADAHTSSWRNWGMLEAGAEPRRPLVTDPGDPFNFTVVPWIELHRTLASVRDGLLGVEAGWLDDLDAPDRVRARAFGRFMQGLALGQLAQLFQSAFIIDETADPATLTLSPYQEVMAAALARLDDAVDVAAESYFVLPAAWVGFDGSLDRDEFVRLARSHRARLAISVARSPSERAAVPWAEVLGDVHEGIVEPWGGRYDGNHETNWAWAMDKLFAGVEPQWARLDYRTIGPADASGAYQAWLAATPTERHPFPIDTDDRRITGGDPFSDGTLVRFVGEGLFRPERGTDHFSLYADRRWAHLVESQGVGLHPDFIPLELDLIEAEARYRLGDRVGAMQIVNRTRVEAGLPAISSMSGPVPGGVRCVPKLADGSCGDLWDALRYEKRIELYHYGAFTEFLDDRGWGDLVPGTFLDFPPVATSIDVLLAEIYGVDASRSFVNDASADALSTKRAAFEAFDRKRNDDPGAVAGS